MEVLNLARVGDRSSITFVKQAKFLVKLNFKVMHIIY